MDISVKSFVVELLNRHSKINVSRAPEIGDLVQELDRLYPREAPSPEPPSQEMPEAPKLPSPEAPKLLPPAEEEKVGTGCIPCSVSHVATVAGQLNEAVRFAREDVLNPEVSIRIDNSLSEIAACERIDLAPENLVNLPSKEKEIANRAAARVRDLRHKLEWFKTADDLEQAASEATALQHDIGREWIILRLKGVSAEEDG